LIAAELVADLHAAEDLGVTVGTTTFDLARLKARKDWLIGTQETWRQRFVDAGFATIDGAATIVDSHTVAVGDRLLTAERILVATGSRTAVPPIDGIDDVPWIDNVGALELTQLPKSLLVMGAGAVGLEFAQAFARFGSHVTIVEGADRIAIRSDADAAAEVHAALEDDGIDIVTGTFVTKGPARGRPHRSDADAARREPRAHGRCRDAARCIRPEAERRRARARGARRRDEPWRIVVDETMRTSVAGIWAAGDVVEGIQLTPVGSYQAQVAVADMFNGSRLADYEVVPTAIFTDPELAQVG